MDLYGDAALAERVKAALQAAGLDKPDLNWSELEPLDQFHLLGLAATKEPAMVANLGRNFREGKPRLLQCVVNRG